MKWYGSLNNRVDENTLQPIPTVGMGATMMMYSDRHAYTVVEVLKGEVVQDVIPVKHRDGKVENVVRFYPKRIMASQDDAKRVKGDRMDGSAEYEFTSDMNPAHAQLFVYHKPTHIYREATRKWDKDSQSHVYIKSCQAKNQSICLGYRDEYYDPSL